MKKTTKTKWIAWGAAVALLALIGALCYPIFSNRLYLWKAGRILTGASTYASHSFQGSGVGGFVYQLKGPLAEADLPKCMEQLGLTKYDPQQHGPLNDKRVSGTTHKLEWWNEASGQNHYYFRHSLTKPFVVRAKWENGKIYFLAFDSDSRASRF